MAGLLWLNGLAFPSQTSGNLDPSWQSALVSAHQDGLQFGRDLIFTYGPLGWLNASVYPPGSITAKLIWELDGKFLLVAVLCGVSRRLNRPDRWFFLIAVLLFTPLFPDALIIAVISLSLTAWVVRADSPRWIAIIVLLGIAVLAQVKFTYALLAGAGVTVAVFSLILQGRPGRAGELGLVFVFTYGILWKLAGQPLDGLPAYWRQSWDISQGYPWAMSLPPQRPWALACGLTAAGINIALFVHIARRHPQKVFAWPALILIGGAEFISWKHGFTRADGHVLSFFLASMLITLALPGLLQYRPAWRWHWLGLTACLVGLYDQNLLLNTPRLLYNRLAQNTHELARLPRLGDAFATKAAGSPLARAIGDSPVDVYNYEQGTVQLAGLHYHPRPIIQGYSAYTPALLKKNLDFLRSPQSADCILLKVQSIDNRHPMLDDSLSMVEIPLRYSHVADIDDFALFKKRPDASPPDPLLKAPIVLEQTVTLGETINLPPAQTHALWLKLKARPSFSGKLRAAVYQPAELYIVLIQSDGSETRHRVIAPMAEAGFLVQPLIETTGDYTDFIEGKANTWVDAIRFEARIPSEQLYWRSFELSLSALNPYPLRKMGSPLLSPTAPFNLRPVRITAKFPPERFNLDQKTAIQVHAPGEMRFTIPAGIHTLRASFGMRTGSYTQGRTDGVTFAITRLSADQHEEVLFQRSLDPVSVPADRGTQTVDLPLGDASSEQTLCLRTLPGPRNNTQWDWSYWTQVRFLP